MGKFKVQTDGMWRIYYISKQPEGKDSRIYIDGRSIRQMESQLFFTPTRREKMIAGYSLDCEKSKRVSSLVLSNLLDLREEMDELKI